MVLGLIALRQGDRTAAQKAFATAIHQASALLTQSPHLFGALDIQGIAFCGLALCESSKHIQAAKEAYKAARAINSDAGIVRRVLRYFDSLAMADTDVILAEVRVDAAGGESS